MLLRMLLLATAILHAAPATAAPDAGRAGCLPSGYDVRELHLLPAIGFAVDDAPTRQALARDLVACLGDPDPAIRDGLAIGALTTWLRGDALDAPTRLALHEAVLAQLRDPRDPGGFRRPFAALALSELMRADRVSPVLDGAQRAAVVAAIAEWFPRIVDFRGYSDREGWRHGVAHGADLVLQTGLNPALGRADLVRLLDALAARVAPNAAVAYIHGEPERLARAVYFLRRRAELDDAWWDRWFDRLASPAPLSDWRAAERSERGLARRHNMLAFLHAVAHAARIGGGGAPDAALLEDADRALATVHGG
jgi:hypothetical protein